jgi:hypothetical protein
MSRILGEATAPLAKGTPQHVPQLISCIDQQTTLPAPALPSISNGIRVYMQVKPLPVKHWDRL